MATKKNQDNPHEHHRERVRQRFLRGGFDQMEDHVKLEFLLYYIISQKDTNPLAHELLNRFGSLANVFEAPVEELKEVRGVGDKTALFLHMIPSLTRAYQESKGSGNVRLFDTNSIGEYLKVRFIGRQNETLVVVVLDGRARVCYCEAIYEGSVQSVPIHIKRIVEIAVRFNACSIILAHNHPSGSIVPSVGDVAATKQVKAALETVQVTLEDHFVITEEYFVSMASLSLL